LVAKRGWPSRRPRQQEDAMNSLARLGLWCIMFSFLLAQMRKSISLTKDYHAGEHVGLKRAAILVRSRIRI
jgi:hypothetical protein